MTRLRTTTLAVFAAALACAAVAVARDRDRDPEARLAAAEQAFGELSYQKALAGFEAAGKADPKLAARPDVRRRIAQCLALLDRWDEAERDAATLARDLPGSVWELRAEDLLGRVFAARPHYGYQVGDRFVRGDTNEEGTYTSTWTGDLRTAVAHLERAKTLAYPLLAAAPDDAALRADVLALNVYLASTLIGSAGIFLPPASEKPVPWQDVRLADAKAYDTSWPLWDKVPFLFDEVAALETDPDRIATHRAQSAKAAFFAANLGSFDHPQAGPVPAAHDPAAILRATLDRYAGSPAAHETHYALAQLLVSREAWPEAVQELERFLAAHPKSKFASDARYHLQDIRRPQLSFDVPPPILPRTQAETTLHARNVSQVDFTAHRINLDAALEETAVTEDWRKSLGELPGLLAESRRVRSALVGEKVAGWREETGDDGTHKVLARKIVLPFKDPGLYLVRAEAGGLTYATLVLVSDLVLVQKSSRDAVVLFAADAMTGTPVAGADLLVREKVDTWENGKERHKGRLVRERTGGDGLCRVPLAPLAEGNSINVQAVARKDGRYAFTPNLWWYPSASGEGATDVVYLHTDRPVYRPGHTVHFKGILRRSAKGEYTNRPNVRLHVVITDPHGNQAFATDATTNEFGSLHGQLALPEGAPLGSWTLAVATVDASHSQTLASESFQVEEYKKPEVEVTVTPAAAQVKLGGKVSVQVGARYYFGAPAADAAVTWQVFRTPFVPTHHRPGPWDWYYGPGYEDAWSTEAPEGRELVAEGSGRTDEKGALTVAFDTAKAAQDFPDQDQRYSVEVKVTDKSRHTVEGSGAVTVTRHEFFAFLAPRQGFYLPGDQVEVEIGTVSPDDAPRPTKGHVTVLRLTYTGEKNDQVNETKLLEDDLTTEADGRAFYKWQPDAEGLFRVRFQAADAWGGTVTGTTDVWVASKETHGNLLHFRDLDVVTDKRTYQEGEVMHLFLSSNWPDQTVLLSQEFENEIVGIEVLPLRGKTLILDLPVARAHRPNFFLRALAVRNGTLFQEQREVFVPPVQEFLAVCVATDKATYKPGEKGRATATVVGADGKPVRCELSLSVFDQSILYIQPETAVDPRIFFHGGRRALDASIQGSPAFEFAVATTDANQYREYRLHGMPPGWNNGGGGAIDAPDLLVTAESRSVGGAGGGFVGGPMPSKQKKDGGTTGAAFKAQADSAKPEPKPAAQPPAPPASTPAPTGTSVPPTVRKNFADSALWVADLVTGPDGRAAAEFTCPDTLTAWHVAARGITAATQAGAAAGQFTTSKNLLIRLAAPRFFTERDEVVVATLVHNYLATAKKVDCTLTLGGGCLEGVGGLARQVEVAAGGEARVDWTLRAARAGQATLVAKALTDEESDAMELSFPVKVHGADKTLTWNGALTAAAATDTATVEIEVPAERRIDRAHLTVRVAPSILHGTLDTIPYLLDYPYGCVEQTMSRFLPAVQVSATLRALGLKLEDIAAQRRQVFTDANLRPRRWDGRDPVFDSAELGRIVKAGLTRLYDFQNGDGGWGWWKEGTSDPYMTAYVVHGLRAARAAEVEVDGDVLERGETFLAAHAAKEEDLNRAAYVASVLAEEGKADAKLLRRLYDRRAKLTGYGKALLALACADADDVKRATVLCENLADFLKVDEKTGTCAWSRGSSDAWWYWYNDDVETNAAILRAYLKVLPTDPRVPQLAAWLLRSRHGVRWKSTKDSALAIGALCEYAAARGELAAEFSATLDYEGVAKKVVQIRKDNLFAFDGELRVDGDGVQDGKRRLVIRREGAGALYWSVELRYFTLEEDMKGAASGIGVKRAYARLVPRKVARVVEGKEVTELVYDRQPLAAGEALKSGDEIEVRLTIDSDNEYEYVMFEDPKPAGCEPVELRSGGRYGGGLCSNLELRDTQVVFFVDWLPKGTRTLTYKLRAEIPGKFHVLPTHAEAMYAPAVRGLADEARMAIGE